MDRMIDRRSSPLPDAPTMTLEEAMRPVPAVAEDPLIRLVGLHKTFGKQRVLQGVDLDIERGKTTVILGRSGEGKSVTIKHMMGLMQPDEGQVLVEGQDLAEMDKRALLKLRQRFGICFQNGALFDSMNVAQNVGFPLTEHTDLKGDAWRQKVEEKLDAVGLAGMGYKMPAELSGGMRKRVGLARAMALDPEIILFDEPTSGLDPVMTAVIDNMIIETQERFGLTVVVISHDLAAAFRVAHRVAMLYKGRIINYGDPQTFQRSPNPIVQQFLEGRASGPMTDT